MHNNIYSLLCTCLVTRMIHNYIFFFCLEIVSLHWLVYQGVETFLSLFSFSLIPLLPTLFHLTQSFSGYGENIFSFKPVSLFTNFLIAEFVTKIRGMQSFCFETNLSCILTTQQIGRNYLLQ